MADNEKKLVTIHACGCRHIDKWNITTNAMFKLVSRGRWLPSDNGKTDFQTGPKNLCIKCFFRRAKSTDIQSARLDAMINATANILGFDKSEIEYATDL